MGAKLEMNNDYMDTACLSFFLFPLFLFYLFILLVKIHGPSTFMRTQSKFGLCKMEETMEKYWDFEVILELKKKGCRLMSKKLVIFLTL